MGDYDPSNGDWFDEDEVAFQQPPPGEEGFFNSHEGGEVALQDLVNDMTSTYVFFVFLFFILLCVVLLIIPLENEATTGLARTVWSSGPTHGSRSSQVL